MIRAAICLLASTLILLVAAESIAYEPNDPDPRVILPPRVVLDRSVAESSEYSGPHGKLLIATLEHIHQQFEHYRRQAQLYDKLSLALRVSILVFSIGSALVLVLGKADPSRRVALVLSILIASVPIADQYSLDPGRSIAAAHAMQVHCGKAVPIFLGFDAKQQCSVALQSAS